MRARNTLAWMVAAACAAWGATGGARAQGTEVGAMAAPQAAPGTLSETIQRVLAEHPDVRSRVYARGAAGEQVTAAGSRHAPRLDVAGTAGRERAETLVGAGATDGVSGPNQRLTLQLAQPLFDGFETRSEVQRQSRFANVRYFELRQVEDQLVSDLARAWIDVQRQTALRDISREALAGHQRLADLLRSRVEAKVARAVDLDQALSRLALSVSTLESDEGALREARARFRRVSLRDAPDPVRAFDVDPAVLPGSERQAVEWALTARSELAIARENLAALGAEREVRRSAFLPKVNLEARHDLNSRTAISPDARVSSLLLTLNYNLFAGGGDSARERDTALRLEQAKEQLAQAGLDVRQAASSAWSEAVRQARVLDKAAEYARTVARTKEAYRLQYDVGQRSLLDLLNNESEVAQARRLHVNAWGDALMAQVRVLLLSGRAEQALGYRRVAVAPEIAPEARSAGIDTLLEGLPTTSVALPRVLWSDELPRPAGAGPIPAAAVTAPVAAPAAPAAVPIAPAAPAAAERPRGIIPKVVEPKVVDLGPPAAPAVTPKVVEPREVGPRMLELPAIPTPVPAPVPKPVEPRAPRAPDSGAAAAPKPVAMAPAPAVPQAAAEPTSRGGLSAARAGGVAMASVEGVESARTAQAGPPPAARRPAEDGARELSPGERMPPLEVIPAFGPLRPAPNPQALASSEQVLAVPPRQEKTAVAVASNPPVAGARAKADAKTETAADAAPAQAPREPPAELLAALERWGTDLASQNLRRFYGLYSASFAADGMDEASWRNQVQSWMRQPRPANARVVSRDVSVPGGDAGGQRALVRAVVRLESPQETRCLRYAQVWGFPRSASAWLIERERMTAAPAELCKG